MSGQLMLPFPDIVEPIGQYCVERRTGTEFIVSEDNRMAQVHLESGSIVMLLCRNRGGQDAIAVMRTMQHGRVRFDDTYVTATAAESFCPEDVLASLRGVAGLPRS